MRTILVTGGTGHLGRDIVRLLQTTGEDRIRVLARRPGTDTDIDWIKGDLGTGKGVAEAVAGVDAIIHAATNSPVAQRGRVRAGDFFSSPDDVDVVGTSRLLAEAHSTGTKHFLHVSIVGVQGSRLAYSRVKATAENLVRDGPVPWSIVPATGFYWLLARMLDQMADRRIWMLPSNLHIQPCDSADFAAYIVTCLEDGPRGVRADFGGPQVLTLPEMARQYQQARGIKRRIVGVRLPRFALGAAGQQVVDDGQHGTTTWSEWLHAHKSAQAPAP